MPPSHHSSSSHSSHSSHSSSRSHSSHSSSSSHSSHSSSSHSSSYSSHSSHSSTTHSGSYGGGYNYNYNHQRYNSVRTRTNQPRGYHNHAAVISHCCIKHDYDYYPDNWTDPETGTVYKSGYYDENGQYYDRLVINNQGAFEGIFACDYCGTKIKLNWKSGEMPKCPNCGASLQIDFNSIALDNIKIINGRPINPTDGFNNTGNYARKKLIGKLIGFATLFFLLPILLIIIAAFAVRTADLSGLSSKTSTVSKTDSIYVEEIGRTCRIKDGDYYDPVTDCYFYFNEDIDVPQWQYWYEGISSDYGDYGWMEYDLYEERWYIEYGDGEWMSLPDTYDTDNLWHFDDPYSY